MIWSASEFSTSSRKTGSSTRLTENFGRELLKSRRARDRLRCLLYHLGLYLGRPQFTSRFRSLPGPAFGLHASQAAKIAIAATEALSAQANLLPTEKTTARTAEVGRLLHLRSHRLARLLLRLLRLLGGGNVVGVHERLRNAWSIRSRQLNELIFPRGLSIMVQIHTVYVFLDRAKGRAAATAGPRVVGVVAGGGGRFPGVRVITTGSGAKDGGLGVSRGRGSDGGHGERSGPSIKGPGTRTRRSTLV